MYWARSLLVCSSRIIPFDMGQGAGLVTGDDVEEEVIGIFQSPVIISFPCADNFVMLYYLKVLFRK